MNSEKAAIQTSDIKEKKKLCFFFLSMLILEVLVWFKSVDSCQPFYFFEIYRLNDSLES